MSTIEWTDETWNPTTGCTKVSQGCKHCYAETFAKRKLGAFADHASYNEGEDWAIERKFTDVRCHPERLDQPLRWKRPRMVFVNSMSDLFHEDVPADFIAQVWITMARTPQHTFQVLTKRPERMRRLLTSAEPLSDFSVLPDAVHEIEVLDRIEAGGGGTVEYRWPLPNVWLGVSVEDQATADERIPILLDTPAAVRFVSYEPALGPVDFTDLTVANGEQWNALDRYEAADAEPGSPNTTLDWLIVGGESGPHARPFDIQWARDTIRQCREAGVPVFCKQLGARPVYQISTHTPERDEPGRRHLWDHPHGYTLDLRDRNGRDMSEWPGHLRIREFPVGERSSD